MAISGWVYRAALALTALTMGVSVAMAAPPVAGADYFENPTVPDAPPGDGMGHVSVSTAPGNTVIVDIVGRYDALDTTGPFANACLVSLGAHQVEQHVVLDETGSGTATLVAPFDGRWALGGSCGTHQPAGSDVSANLNLFAPFAPLCPDCSSRAYALHLVGAPYITGPKYARPAPRKEQQQPDLSCTDSMRQTFDQYGASAEVADLAAALAKKPKPDLAGKAYGACALIADNPRDAFLALCNVGRSMIPADWAYLAITELGRQISNEDVESFGQSASDSWNAQCR